MSVTARRPASPIYRETEIVPEMGPLDSETAKELGWESVAVE